MDLALNNLQKLICHKTQPTNPSNPIVNTTQLIIPAELFTINDVYTLYIS